MRFFILILLFFRCGAGSVESEEPSGRLAPSPPPIKTKKLPHPDKSCQQGSTLSYENFGAGFISEYCISCHSQTIETESRFDAPEEINFDSSQDIKIWRARILQMYQKKDPHKILFGRIPSKKEEKNVIEWLECGAPGP